MPGRFENSSLQQWKTQEEQPAAPAGMRQDAQAARGFEAGGGNRFANSSLAKWVSQDGYTGAAQSWYTGQNRSGTNNGWSSDYWDRAMSQRDQLAEQGKLGQQFEQNDATGVVLWDHDSSDGTQHFAFGDVYDNGKHVGNVFKQFDKVTASTMMSDLLFDPKVKAEIFSDSDREHRVVREVQDARHQNNTDIPKGQKAAEFTTHVKERAKGFEEGHVDDAIVGGGALGGAAVGAAAGAAAGSAFFGVGALPGALVGGIAGALSGAAGAEMNKDALTEQAARAYEITSMSKRENGTGAAWATGISQWSGFAGKAINPLQNLNQGLADVTYGKRGDGEAEFYRVDDKGNKTIPKWLRVTDVAAAIGDAALQFATPIGAGLYTAQMSGTILGESAELGLTHGKTFDYTRGGFDSIFTDDDGKFSPTGMMAGIGKIGIDVVQLGMVRGLAGKVDSARVESGGKAIFGSRKLTDKLPSFLGGRTAEQKAALAADGHEFEHAGFRFVTDASGKAVGRAKPTLSLLAPSEQLASLGARVGAARRVALRRSRGETNSLIGEADDFYRAAHAMATGERRLVTTIVTGMGEGYEEAVQAVLEPYSHDNSLSLADIGNSALYGFAMGTGMGAGMGARMPSADEKMYNLARTAHMIRTQGDGELTRTDWNKMSAAKKRQAAAMTPVEQGLALAAYKKIAADMSMQHGAGVVGTAKLRDAIMLQLASNLDRATAKTDGAFTIAPIEDAGRIDEHGNLLPGAHPGDAVLASARQTQVNLNERMRGHAAQLESLGRDVKKVTAELAAKPDDEDLGRRLAELTAHKEMAELTEDWGRKVLEFLDGSIERMYDENATVATVEAEVDFANRALRDMFHMNWTDGSSMSDKDKMAVARAVTQLLTRDPQDQAGSYQALVPQISVPLTISLSDNLLQVPSGILAAISGDHDGDKVRPQNQLILSDEEFTTLRSGAHFLGAGSTVSIAAPKDEKTNVDLLAAALPSSNTALANYAAGTLTSIGSAIRNRYTGVVADDVIDGVLQRFFDKVHANDKDARDELINGLAKYAGGPLTEFSRKNLSNEWLWIDHMIRSTMQTFQETQAAHRPIIAPAPNTDRVPAKRQSTAIKERRITHAATVGATAGLLLAGDTPFRQSQKLHYSSLVAAVLSAEHGGGQADVYALAGLYEALGQGLGQSELDNVRAKDQITGRVFLRLQRIAEEATELNDSLSRNEALAVVANVSIADIDIAEDGTVTPNGKRLSLAQFLLKESVAQDRLENDLIYDISPELQKKHNRLLAMTRPPTQGVPNSRPVNAERAFIEVVGSQQLFTLLGDEADVFGPHLTVEQWLRDYISMSETRRQAMDIKLKGEAPYFGRKRTSNIPYGLDEVNDPDSGITAYRAMVDAMIAVGHNRITADAEAMASDDVTRRHLHGELANQHYEASGNVRDFHEQARHAIIQFLGLSPRADGELTVEVVQRMLEGNPDWARQVMELIPNSAAPVVLQQRGNQTFIANWVYEFFTMRDSHEAEMHYYRNLVLAEWEAAGIPSRLNEEEATDGQKGREFNDLKRRIHRVMWRLAAMDDGGYQYERFIHKMETGTNLEMFLRWVNRTPGIRGEQAPIVGWVDDVAGFDMDKANGGWSQTLSGAELREAISSLQAGTNALVKDLAEEQAALNDDLAIVGEIRQVLKGKGTQSGQALHDQLAEAIKQAGKLVTGLGPQAMIHQIVGAVYGLNAQSHAKGKNPDNVRPAGALDAYRDAFDYTTNYERVLASLTSVNLDAVSNNLNQVAKDGGRTMDDDGSEVTWETLTVEQVLDLLEDADSRPQVRAMLFPQVMERTFDGSLRPQLLVGKSLGELLDGTSHNDLFPKADTLSQDSALRYVAMVEAQARKHGGHFAIQRAANDIAIARTSAADHTLTMYEVEQLAVKTLHEMARVLQKTGAMAARARLSPGQDPMASLWQSVRESQRVAAIAARLNIEVGDRPLTDVALDQIVKEREIEAKAEVRAILAEPHDNQDAAEVERLAARAERVEEEVRLFKERLELMRDDHLVDRALAMYAYDTAAPDADKVVRQRELVDFISNNLHVIQTASATLITLNKLTNQLLDSGRNGRVDLTDDEWTEISNAVIGVFLDRVAAAAGVGISAAPFPDANHADNRKYFDNTFAYIAEPLVQGALVEAAADVHLLAGRHQVFVDETDVVEELGRTIFAEFTLGTWTSDIPRLSIEAGERLFSAAAEPAIAMAGNSPKRQAVESAATRRTFRVPDDALLSTVSLNSIDLAGGSESVTVEFPGGNRLERPLVQLNNRFARSVVLTYTDQAGAQQQVDLLAADPGLGRVWHDERAAGTGLQEINLERLQLSVDRYMTARYLSPASATVDVQFFHPDSQPTDPPAVNGKREPTWYNNLFFEGTSFTFDADTYESLNAGLWFSPSGINQTAQRAALDASKEGKPALEVVETPTAQDRADLEADWPVDFAAMLRAKTEKLFETPLGFGSLDPAEFYNAVYKNMKMRHFVRGKQPGTDKLVMWDAEKVIAHQQSNPGVALPIDEAALWVPSDDVLHTLLGELGTQGVPTIFPDQLEVDLAAVPTWRGVTPEMVQKFTVGVAGKKKTLAQTRIANRARQQVLQVRPYLDEATRNAYDVRVKFLAIQREESYAARAAWSGRTDDGGFNPATNLANVLHKSDTMFRAEDISMDWSAIGIPYVGPRKPRDTGLSRMLLHELERALQADGGFRAGWTFREGAQALPPKGLLSGESLREGTELAMRIAPGDLVAVELDSFRGNWELAAKRIDYLTNRGATIILTSADGSSGGRAEMAEHLDVSLYTKIAGSVHVYQPTVLTSRYQNLKARTSTLLETRGISRRNNLTILNVVGKGIQEGGAWVDFDNPNLSAVAVSLNLVPSDYLAGFNVPVETAEEKTSQIELVRQQLFGLDTPEGRTMLRKLSHPKLTGAAKDQADKDFDRAWKALIRRLADNPGRVLPQPGDTFGDGDMIPLVDGHGRVLLYRHGMKAPHRDDVDEMTTAEVPGSHHAANVAVYSHEQEPTATTHTGRVRRFKPRAGHGLSVELEIDLQVLGDKKVLEWNGMKYILTPRPKSVALPDHGHFETGQGIDLIVDTPGLVSKEAHDGLVNNHRNAFAYFGIDFTQDVAKLFGVDETQAVSILRAAAQTFELTVRGADEILNLPSLGNSLRAQLPALAQAASELGVDPSWATDLEEGVSVEAQIVKALLVYLSTPGAKVEHVLHSGGFNDPTASPDAQSVLMPRLFTQVFDNAPLGSPLRREINRRLNEQLYNPHQDGTGYSLAEDFTFVITHPDPTKNLQGHLQFAEAHSAGDNPVKNGMSYNPAGTQSVSYHSGAIAYQSIGAQTAYTVDIAKARAFAEGKGITRFAVEDGRDGGAWRMLNDIDMSSAQRWRGMPPAEAARRNMARDAVTAFRQPLQQREDFGWDTAKRADYGDLARKIVEHLGLKATQVGLVDFWVRQMQGDPYSPDKEGDLSAAAAIEAAKEVWWNVERGYLPTVSAMVPLMHAHDLQLLYRVNQHRTNGTWAPRWSVANQTGKASTWDEWVEVALGSALTTDSLFDPLYLLALDGHLHTYQAATRSLIDLPVSMSPEIAMQLLNPETNEMLVSLDPNQELLATETLLLDVERATLDELIGGQRVAGVYKTKAAPASEIAKRREKIRQWRKETGTPMPVDTTMRNFRKNGAEFVHHSTVTNALARSLINLRVGTAMINPALYMSMGPEQWVRGVLDRAANMLTGQSTTGATTRLTAAASQSLSGRAEARQAQRRQVLEEQLAKASTAQQRDAIQQQIDGLSSEGALAALGLQHRFTPDQLTKLGRLYKVLGDRNDFKAMVYRDLMFLRPGEPGVHKIERWLEAYAKFGAKMQDPTWGMRADTLARRYLEAVLMHLDRTPTETTLTTDRLVSELSVNPTFLKDNFPAAHEAGVNAIAQIRSLKPTMLSQTLRGIYEPLSESSNAYFNFIGNVVLKMPLLFSGYAMNVLTSVTGLQGIDQMVAAGLHGRQNPRSLFGRVRAKLRGEEFTPDDDALFDYSSVMEGIDLSRAFIRGGLTHTGLFMFGMAAGGLGLSGEDDETKKRRRLAKLQGAAFVYDPRAIENDFRNSDAVFLDWLPFASHWWGVGEDVDGDPRSIGQLHWMMKQFVSPIMGFERFYETGDFRHVMWGFEDAVGAFPLINTLMWNDAVETANEFASMADDEAKPGGPANMVHAAGLLTNGVGVYERMLFENAFVNQLYSSFDRYDRDPYKLPLRDSDGVLQRDIEGNARAQNLTVEQYIAANRDQLKREIAGGQWQGQLSLDENGEIQVGYLTRDQGSATLHAMTENRATLAFAMSMFTGQLGDSDYFRRNMPIKTRTIEKTPITQDQAEAVVRKLSENLGGQELLSADELAQLWKNQAKAAGVFVDWGKVDQAAADYLARAEAGKPVDMSLAPANPAGPAPMSVLDQHGREVLTKDGAAAVFRGLFKGSAKAGDESLAGIYIPFEMREQIQKDWMKELVQEGVDIGLDLTKATSRMKRLWYGPTSDPSIQGLGDILWDKNISYAGKAEYNQLNTTYVIGPDGLPWATGFTRDGLLGALGLKPVKRAYVSEQAATGNDVRLNTTDLVNNMNTGLRALELVDDSRYVPTDVEIGKSIEAAIKEAARQDYQPMTPYAKKSGGYGGFGGYHRYGRGYGHRSYGGGGYSGGGSYFTRMYALPHGTSPYANNIPFINTSNPLIRRGDVRRERVWSERGRLKQWQ